MGSRGRLSFAARIRCNNRRIGQRQHSAFRGYPDGAMIPQISLPSGPATRRDSVAAGGDTKKRNVVIAAGGRKRAIAGIARHRIIARVTRVGADRLLGSWSQTIG
jgi:hypothetical protein